MVLSKRERLFYLNCYCSGSCQRVDSESQEGLPTDKNEAIAKLDEWHEAGVPFFTREVIRDINQQINGPFTPDQKILVKGLDGVSVEFDVVTGQAFSEVNGRVSELLNPEIDYKSYTHLKRDILQGNIWPKVYCPLQIMFPILFKDRETEEPILPHMKGLQKVRGHFQTRLQQWTAKRAFRKLESILSNSAAKHKIDKIIAIACGSMASDDLPGHGDAPYDQHAQVVTVRKWAANKSPHDVACYAQDPVYTEIDESILNEHGIQVIKDPQAWLEVDDSSVVFSFYPNIPVRDILADLARPAVLICNRLDVDEEVDEVENERADPQSSRVLAMFEEYEAFEFWDRRANLSNRDIVAYVRK